MDLSSAQQFVQRLLRRRSFYRRVFIDSGQAGAAVLADLRRFCKAGDSALVVSNGQSDVMATGMAMGRQEVFWRIVNHLHLDDAQLLRLKEQSDE